MGRLRLTLQASSADFGQLRRTSLSKQLLHVVGKKGDSLSVAHLPPAGIPACSELQLDGDSSAL